MNTTEDSDFKVVAAIAAVAQHSIIPEYATDRPDEDDISILNDFAEKIRDKKEAISTELDVEIEDEATESKLQLLLSLRFQNLQIPV